jgi:poly(A) polymerase
MQTFKGMNQGKHHDYDLWEHSIRTVHFTETILQNLNNYFPQHGNALIDYFKEQLENGINRSNLLKFISLIHDTGKPSALAQNANNVIFYGHDIIGRRINQGIAKRFKIGNKSSTIITAATQNHMRLLNLSQLNIITSRAKFRFFYDLNSAALDTIVLAIADLMSTRKCSPGSDDHIPILNLVSDLIDYYFCEYSSKSIKPLINGHEIMEILNLEPGERIGELLCLIEDAERKGAVSNRDEAIKFITSHHIKTTENR